MTNVPIIKFLFRNEWQALTDALSLATPYGSDEFDSISDVTTYLSGTSSALIIFSLQDKNDLIQLASLLKVLKKSASETFVKITVINFSGNKQFERAVEKLGILDLLEARIQTKALRFKIDFMMKSINAQLKKTANVQNNNAVKSLENAKNQEKKGNENLLVWSEALECEDDIWLLRNETDCKKILTRWLIKLLGPSPYVASWVDSGTPGIWKFEFKSANSVFTFGKGSWFYRGDQKPDFIWAENIWSFTGNSFDLFYKDGNDVFSRLKLKDKQITIAKTSSYAKAKEKSIIESFDKDLVFRKELQSNGDKESFESEQDQFKNLEGKNKTENINQGPLSGKSKTDTVNHDPLSGKSKTSNLSSDPLSLDLKPDDKAAANDPLSQKTNTSKSSSFWKGKNEYDKDEKGELTAPTDAAIKAGSELSLENSSTHQKYYKNHNEAEKFEEKELGYSVKKDGVSDNLRGKNDPSKSSSAAGGSDLKGKSATDQVEGHLTSPNARKETSPVNKTENELSGKSSTDKMQSHLSSLDAKRNSAGNVDKDKKEHGEISGKEAKSEKANSESKVENAQAEKAGKHEKSEKAERAEKELKADKVNAERTEKAEKADQEIENRKSKSEAMISDPKGNHVEEKKKNSANSAKEKELSGKSTTDKLDGHLSSKSSSEKLAESHSKESNENEAKSKPSAAKMAEHLAALRAKKDKIEKAKETQEALESEEAQANTGKENKGGTEKITSIYASRTKTASDNKTKDSAASHKMEESQNNGKVLPFSEKESNKSFESMSLGSKQLDDAVETAIVTSYLIQDSVKILCNLDDYFDQTIIFNTTEDGISPDKSIKLNLNFNYMSKDTTLKFDGKILQIEADGTGSQYITVQISKENSSSFNSFIKLYNTRQENINLFLKTAKGE
ncbi:MAG: hypothetical protein H0V66_01430 [Bdellovibrionales bacterium]|nr:hypothetical protein [Bdellovibrionales bacterium]